MKKIFKKMLKLFCEIVLPNRLLTFLFKIESKVEKHNVRDSGYKITSNRNDLIQAEILQNEQLDELIEKFKNKGLCLKLEDKNIKGQLPMFLIKDIITGETVHTFTDLQNLYEYGDHFDSCIKH